MAGKQTLTEREGGVRLSGGTLRVFLFTYSPPLPPSERDEPKKNDIALGLRDRRHVYDGSGPRPFSLFVCFFSSS